MTKKHFIELADTIRNSAVFSGAAIERLADFCASQNPNFNRQRWLDYIAGKCQSGGRGVK